MLPYIIIVGAPLRTASATVVPLKLAQRLSIHVSMLDVTLQMYTSLILMPSSSRNTCLVKKTFVKQLTHTVLYTQHDNWHDKRLVLCSRSACCRLRVASPHLASDARWCVTT